MKICYLGPDSLVTKYLTQLGNEVLRIESRIFINQIKECSFLVCYGYRFKINDKVLSHFGQNAVNLHISFLPWNKGADPNLWSWINDTPKGVTIHRLTNDIDCGDILLQKEVLFPKDSTLITSHSLLREEVERLFISNWGDIKDQKIIPIKQQGRGSYHRSKDKAMIAHLLTDGLNTKVSDLPIIPIQ